MRNSTLANRIGTWTIAFVVLVFSLMCLYPILSALAISLNDPDDTARGGVTIYPREFTFTSYQMILSDRRIPRAMLVSIGRTVSGTLVSLVLTGLFAYAMSKRYLMFRNAYMTICVIAMYFSGGLIPLYLLIARLGLMNNFLVYIIPTAVNIFNMIIMRTFFRQLPEALEESAYMDGAGPYTIFFRIILPVSTPIIATISLFVGVAQWNAWLDAALYMTRTQDLWPMQNILIEVLNTASFYNDMLASASGTAAEVMMKIQRVSVRSARMAVMMITIVPILCVYPFMQKYFAKGIMIGSLKG